MNSALRNFRDNKDTYFKIIPRKVEYAGERYFRYNPQSNKVVQVCLSAGDVKKGKSNTFGIYLISKITFCTNYLAMGYVDIVTEKQYKDHFEDVLKLLR